MTLPDRRPLVPVPETLRAVDALEPTAELDPLAGLLELGELASQLVPSLVGLSVAYNACGVVLTLVASDERIAMLDAMQYVDGGPCVDAMERGRVVESDPDALLDEGRWKLFARGSAAAHVSSTLTIPVLDEGQVTGTVNLYAGDPQAFAGRQPDLAEIFGGWAAGATSNADLSFATREAAREAPDRLAAEMAVETAVGVVAALTGQDVAQARRTLQEAADRAGVSLLSLAHAVVETRRWP